VATGAIFDSVIPGAARGALFQLSLALVVSALAAALFQLTRGIASLRLRASSAFRFRRPFGIVC